MAYPLNTLTNHPNSGTMAAIPWRFATEHSSQKGDYLLGPDGVTCTEVVEVNWGDLKAACVALLGYSYRLPNGTAELLGNITPQAIIAATNASPPVVTTAAPHRLIDGDTVFISGILGNTICNGRVYVIVIDATRFALADASTGVPLSPTGNGTYLGGGEWFPTGSHLSRKLPWQHPIFNQTYVKRIVSVHGRKQAGTSENLPVGGLVGGGILVAGGLGGAGPGASINNGPWVNFDLATITVEFWRPPYAVRSDADVWGKGQRMEDGIVADAEWARYIDRQWELSTQLLSREDTAFNWATPANGAFPDVVWSAPKATPIRGGAGQKITHERMTKKWYQIPEACLFQLDANGVPLALPLFLMMQQRSITNPISLKQTFGGEPVTGCVNAPMGGGVNDVYATRFLGSYMGELMYEGVEITSSQLQLPPDLMQIPAFKGSNEPLSQVQYDVTFHWDRFDPPRGPGVPFRGHNLLPWTGDGLWYPVVGQRGAAAGIFNPNNAAGNATTMFQYCDMADLFQVL